MRDIVVVGSLNVDVSVRATRLPRAGETVRADGLVIGPGGKGLNQAVAAARLGARVHMVGRVGDDVFGEIPRQTLREAGVEDNHVRASSASHTGTALIIVDAETGQNQIAVAGGANRDVTPEDVRDAIAAFRASGVLLVQLELGEEAVDAALELAQANGVRTILDPAPARELSDATLARIDLMTPNETEAEALTGIEVSDVESAARAGAALRDQTGGDVIVTIGSHGCVWANGTGFEHIPAPPVEPLDTVGAGDAFNGALAAALAREDSFGTALRYAVRAASASTLKRGAATSMPSEADVQNLPQS